MKKSRILGYALTLAATLMVGSAMGQIKVDYTRIDADPVSVNKSYVTVAKKVSFYVQPDAAFSTAYVASTNAGIAVGNTWKWTIDPALTVAAPTLTAGVGPAATGAATDKANYVELSAAAAGVYPVSVVEQGSGALACASTDVQSFAIHVFPAPTMSFAGTSMAYADAICGSGTHTVAINVTAADKVKAQWKLKVYAATVNAAGTDYVLGAENTTLAETFNWNKEAVGTTLTGGWVISGGTGFVEGNATTTPANASYTLTSSAKTYTADGTNVLTVYKYFIDGSAGNGVNDYISRKSDYHNSPASETYYGAASEFVVIVKRAPKTGPVYHIANNKYN